MRECLGAGIGGGDYGVSRVSGTKTTQKSTFFKMGVSLGRPIGKRDIIWTSNRRRTGTITQIPTRVLTPRVEGGGGTLIFSYIRGLGSFFWVQNCEFQYFWGFSEKINIFWGMTILWIFLGVIAKLDYI